MIETNTAVQVHLSLKQMLQGIDLWSQHRSIEEGVSALQRGAII